MEWPVALLVLLASCANPQGVAVDRVVPAQGTVGEPQPVDIDGTFRVLTNDIDRGDTTIATLTASVSTMPIADATWLSTNRIQATMPGLPEGSYDVTVTIDGRSDTLTNGYTVLPAGAGTDGGVNSGTYQITVVGPVTGGPLADFPLLVDLQDPRLATTANGGTVANAAGFDISFSLDQAGTQPLSHEIEKYGAGTGELVAWVKVPFLDANTVLFLHAGDPTLTSSLEDVPGVWTAGYGAVYHLDDAKDSTANNNTGVDTNTGSDPAGQIELARTFNGTNSRITVPATTSINNVFATGGTVTAWIFVDTPGQSSLGRVFEKATIVRIGNCDGGGVPQSLYFTHEFNGNPGTWCTPQGSLVPGGWTHVAVTYDKRSTANVPTIYIGGVAQQTTIVDVPSGSAFNDSVGPLVIGDRDAGLRAFDGRIDELRFAKTVRSAGWIKTSYDNQHNPNNFVMLAP